LKKSVYLSAPALVCCAGRNRDELYRSCLNGWQGGFVPRETGGRKFPVGQISGDLPTVDVPPYPPEYAGKTRIIRVINAALEQLSIAVEKALSKYGPQRIGVCLGSCDNGSEATLMAHNELIQNNSFPGDYSLRFQSASFSAEFVSGKFSLRGPVLTTATACASGASAIIRGAELIQSGFCDAVIAGGADIVSDTVFFGFHALEAVSDSLTNPFSKNRKGINLGEGAAFFLLDSDSISAVELLGSGESADAFHMTAPGPEGAGPVQAMKAALSDAGTKSEQIDYINLHGTGTNLSDKAEALAMGEVFNALAPPASSTKPITGHTQGAAGALEAAICWMTLTEQRGLPVHCWDGVRDEDIPFFNPVGRSGLTSASICMSNSFAFGGCNVSLILGRKSS